MVKGYKRIKTINIPDIRTIIVIVIKKKKRMSQMKKIESKIKKGTSKMKNTQTTTECYALILY